MDNAAYFSRYHAGEDIDDSELVPLPESVAERAKILVEFHAYRAEFDCTIPQWCADNAYDASVAEWLHTQENA